MYVYIFISQIHCQILTQSSELKKKTEAKKQKIPRGGVKPLKHVYMGADEKHVGFHARTPGCDRYDRHEGSGHQTSRKSTGTLYKSNNLF